MRIVQALGILFVSVSCGSAMKPNLTTPTATVANQPCTSPSFGDDRPIGAAPSAPGGMVATGAPDPTVTDGDKYHVILENERVRVLRYQDRPGDKTKPHHHAEFVLYALSSFRRRLSFPDGSVRERDFKPGDVIWMPEQSHTGENVGVTDTDVIIVENKLAASVPILPSPSGRCVQLPNLR
jgi:beta-alanine degradation protein BauB